MRTRAARFTAGVTNKATVWMGAKPRRVTKKPASTRPKRKTLLDRKTSKENYSGLLMHDCRCERNCNQHFSAADILNLRKEVLSQKQDVQNTILMDRLKKYGHVILPEEGSSSAPKFQFQYVLNGARGARQVCSKFWWSAIGISKTRFYRLKSVRHSAFFLSRRCCALVPATWHHQARGPCRIQEAAQRLAARGEAPGILAFRQATGYGVSGGEVLEEH
mmetsp:Transcript_28077/g.61445  ORF Transcript_28077/g.61445 Transcript_28077/m.61445 type:complete len:219 (-) Transcript_28077:1043-1699(-)